jgi:hypothetical protein
MAKYRAKATFHIDVTVDYIIDMDKWKGEDDELSRAVMADEEANVIVHHMWIEFQSENVLQHSYETVYEVGEIKPIED